MYKNIFKIVKKIIPRISDTELIALRSGTTSLDKNIFEGKVNLQNFTKIRNKYEFPIERNNFILEKYGSKNIYPSEHINDVLTDLGKNKYFSFIIDKEYSGTKLSVDETSRVLTHLTSLNPSIGVTVMVPNSLGPGELLTYYGTKEQKDKYLKGLANGKYIPCFGLTGPNNGSDATGTIDSGKLIEKNGKKYIEIEINKRYITLAPVANLIGLAFNLEDPDNLLKEGTPGVTVALIESDHPGLIKETHHIPNNAGFPNGTLKGKLLIDVEQIIGGEKNAGVGWKMLMECLAAGRAVSLPATANASSKVSTYGVYNYIRHRKQFKMPLIKMEGVQEKFIEMLFHTWAIQSSISLTNNILDSGEKPAVLSAIMKQQTTDRAREVLNNGMDIHAGSAICLGENNFMEKFYRSAPIGITVEGSNTLTRNLIIFGQGLNKSHPCIYPILDSVLTDNVSDFRKSFNKMVGHCVKLYFKSLVPNLSSNYETCLKKQTVQFAHLSNIVALKGGLIKKEQFLSADMADIFSNLYLSYAIIWYENSNQISPVLTKYCVERLLNENKVIMNRVISNMNYKFLLFHMRSKAKDKSYNNNTEIINEVLKNNKIMNSIKEDLYVNGTILEELNSLNHYERDSKEYKELYNKVIQVGEYPNKN